MKIAYPNYSADFTAKPMYNLGKWLNAMRDIYARVHFGNSFKEAFGTITDKWDEVEKRDFKAWIEYYQSGNQNKYKIANANFYVNDNIPGYFVPNPQKAPPPVVPDMSEPISIVKSDLQEKLDKEERRKKIEEQRKRIIGRLNSAIKHLTAYEGHLLAGDEFNKLLASMYELVKQIQTVNKISISNQIYYDLIIRQSNKLLNGGFLKSASFLKKIADNTNNMNNSGRLDATGLPIASVSGNGPAGGTLENPTPSIESISKPPPKALQEPAKSDSPLDEFLENLETAGLTDFNSSEDEDLDEVSLDDDLYVEAQMATIPQQSAPVKEFAPIKQVNKPLEVSLSPDEISEKPETDQSNIDSIIDSALKNITIKDVITKIEDVNSIFQNRTIARELSIIDLMLSNLGLSSYFNSLSEIIQKNHEASNYSISRLSDILTKLRGAVTEDKIDLNVETPVSPEIMQVKQKLQEEKNKEENRKEMRKQLQDNALEEEAKEPTNQPTNPAINTPTNLTQEINNTPVQVV